MDGKTHVAYRWLILGYIFLINLVFNGGILMIMPPLFPEISRELGLSYARIGFLWGAHPLGMLLFSLIGGVIADRLGVKNVLSIALLIAAILAGLRGLSASFLTLWFCMFFFGVSYGFIIPNLTKCVAMWFDPRELGRANGILLMGFSMGAGMGMGLGAPLGALLGSWQNLMVGSGFLALIFWALWVLLARDPDDSVGDHPGGVPFTVLQGLRQVFSVKEMWLICIAEFFIVGSHHALMGLMPVYLVHIGETEAQAGLITSLSYWTAIAGFFVGPYLSDRIGLRKVFTWPFFLIYVILIVMVVFLRGWPLLLSWGLAGFIHGCAMPVLRTIITELEEIGPALSGSAFGGIFSFNRMGGFAIPWVMGLMMTTTGIPATGLYFVAGVSIIPPMLVFFIRETGPRLTLSQR